MVGPGNNNRGGGYGGYQDGRRRDFSQRPAEPPVQTAQPMRLPEDFADAAEAVIKSLRYENRYGNTVIDITNTKIRRLFSLIIPVFNKERLRSDEKLTPESRQTLMMARVRMAYEAGRDGSVKDFIAKAKLMEYVKGVGDDREEFIRFAHYMEALVAWHRYYGDKD